MAAEIRAITGLGFSDVFNLELNRVGRLEAGEDAYTQVKNTLRSFFVAGECLATAVLPALV